MGLGNMGGANQALFGSSGGQDVFQKLTWGCLVIVLTGSLFLAVLKGKYRSNVSSYLPQQSRQVAQEDDSNQ